LPGRAKAHDLNLTVDAEEADRLELSLDVIAATSPIPPSPGGMASALPCRPSQAAAAVIVWADDLGRRTRRRMMVRLVKGAYWDSEVKRAQERGLADYPVFTRKAATDQSYLACARRLLAARPRLYPQFATHNALTVATIIETAGRAEGFEFQRLHGMGEALYEAVTGDAEHIPCRIYAPVGGHRDLLAYLVRRLLENWRQLLLRSDRRRPLGPDRASPATPAAILDGGERARHSVSRFPPILYLPARRNSAGIEFGSRHDLQSLVDGIRAAGEAPIAGGPLSALHSTGRSKSPGRQPVERKDGCRQCHRGRRSKPSMNCSPAAERGFGHGSRTCGRCPRERPSSGSPISSKASAMGWWSLLAREGGKTLVDGVAEVREGVDYCRYYAAEAGGCLPRTRSCPARPANANVLAPRARRFRLHLAVELPAGDLPRPGHRGARRRQRGDRQARRADAAHRRPRRAAAAPGRRARRAAQLAPGDGKIGAALVAIAASAGVASPARPRRRRDQPDARRKDGPIVPFIAENGGINAMIVDATALPEQVTDDVILALPLGRPALLGAALLCCRRMSPTASSP
jgi:RHH-type proline utilization regulon transcriptional repressor/proline dehydrogenase/delta 1-pyrroline-5-carboxylate dehydrogenase